MKGVNPSKVSQWLINEYGKKFDEQDECNNKIFSTLDDKADEHNNNTTRLMYFPDYHWKNIVNLYKLVAQLSDIFQGNIFILIVWDGIKNANLRFLGKSAQKTNCNSVIYSFHGYSYRLAGPELSWIPRADDPFENLRNIPEFNVKRIPLHLDKICEPLLKNVFVLRQIVECSARLYDNNLRVHRALLWFNPYRTAYQNDGSNHDLFMCRKILRYELDCMYHPCLPKITFFTLRDQELVIIVTLHERLCLLGRSDAVSFHKRKDDLAIRLHDAISPFDRLRLFNLSKSLHNFIEINNDYPLKFTEELREFMSLLRRCTAIMHTEV